MHINQVSGHVIDASFRVHTRLGPGLLESVYESCLVYELRTRQVPLPIVYDEVNIAVGYRIDLIVEDAVLVEIKAVDAIHSVHKAQILSYLRLSGKKVGLLLNFNVTHFKDGIIRVVNDL